MPDLCEECRHFISEHKKLKDIGENIPKKGNRLSDYISQPKCMLGHRIVKSIDGFVPHTSDYVCGDFIIK